MDPEAIASAARRVQREWGETGYSVERVEPGPVWGGAILHVVHADGSRFAVGADRYGNRVDLDPDD